MTGPGQLGSGGMTRASAAIMLERKIGCRVVLEHGKIAGILTESDFVKLALRDSPMNANEA